MRERDDEIEDEKPSGGIITPERAISAIRKRRRIVILLPVVLALLTVVLVLSMPNRYDADALVQINPRNKVISNLDTVVSDLKGDQPTVESEVEIIRSRPVILQVIETLGLRNDPEFVRKSTFDNFLESIGFGKPKKDRSE